MPASKRLSTPVRAFLITFALLAVGASASWYKITSMGHDALFALAKEGQFCKTSGCSDGVDYAKSYLAEEFGLSPRLVEWCMGVDALGGTRPQANVTFSSGLLDALYLPCGEPIVE